MYSNDRRMDKALEGVDRIVIITPFSEEMLRVNNSWVDAAKRNKIGFIIKSGGIPITINQITNRIGK